MSTHVLSSEIFRPVREKIILGTVQLGIPYGINNATGKPTREEAFRILDFAYDYNIRTLDSADGYGEALQLIGDHKTATGKSFYLINKFTVDEQPLLVKLNKSLEVVQCDSLYCYMYHQFSDYEAGAARRQLLDFREKQLIKKIGISIYNIEQLTSVIKDPHIDVIQLPVNILDLGREKKTLLQQAKEAGKEIHARSAYLQGLFLKRPETLSGNMIPLRNYLGQIRAICLSLKIELKLAALNFVLHQEFIDKVVLGVERLAQLKENLTLIRPSFGLSLFEDIQIKKDDAHLLNPVNWRP